VLSDSGVLTEQEAPTPPPAIAALPDAKFDPGDEEALDAEGNDNGGAPKPAASASGALAPASAAADKAKPAPAKP